MLNKFSLILCDDVAIDNVAILAQMALILIRERDRHRSKRSIVND